MRRLRRGENAAPERSERERSATGRLCVPGEAANTTRMKSGLAFACGVVCGGLLVGGTVSRLQSESVSKESSVLASRDGAPAVADTEESALTHRQNAERETAEAKAGEEQRWGPLAERVAWLKAIGRGERIRPRNGDTAEKVLEAWSSEDPRAALEFVQNAAHLRGRMTLAAIPLGQIAHRDSAFAVNWLHTQLDEAERPATADALVRWMAVVSPLRALELAEALPVSTYAKLELIGELVKADASAAVAAFERLPPREKEIGVPDFIALWSEQDLSAAERWCEGLPSNADNKIHGVAFGALAERYMEKAPEKLVELLRERPKIVDNLSAEVWLRLIERDEGFAFKALSSATAERQSDVLLELARAGEPDVAFSALGLLKSMEDRKRTALQLYADWTLSDRRAAEAWLSSQNDAALVKELQTMADGARAMQVSMGVSAGALDPRESLQRISNVSGGEAEQLRTTLLWSWSDRDPQAAAAWVSENWAQTTSAHIRDVADKFVARDEEAATRWLASVPAGPLRDAASAGAAVQWAGSGDLALTDSILTCIGDPAKRLAATYNVFMRMKGRDAAVAQTWLQRQPLSEEMKTFWRGMADDSVPLHVD
jgi:hypothetical protein